MGQMQSSLQRYVDRFQNLRAGRVGTHTRPHKPVMLLSVLTLAESGRLLENRIEFGPELIEIFRGYFEIVRAEDDDCTPINPFFYLRGDGFWHHKPLPGGEEFYKAMKDPGGMGLLSPVIAFAYLDDELFSLFAQASSRLVLRDSLISRYFPGFRESLEALYEKERQVGQYREYLESQTEGPPPIFEDEIRDSAFRRVVIGAYDSRCAACGLRVILGDDILVEAAHLIPFSISKDDDPRNGIALCKNHHWAMDKFLIAPGSDRLWHVSGRLERRIRDLQPLLDLDGQKILMPREIRFHPKEEALSWRVQHLLSQPDILSGE
jgi:putative restriction endonuclease